MAGAALITKSRGIANTCFEKNRSCRAGMKPAQIPCPKKNLAISSGADILALTQKSNERLQHTSGLARRDGKRTWKTPKAAQSRNLTGRRRQGARTAKSPGAARANVAGNPATLLIPLRMSLPAMPDSLRARWKMQPEIRPASASVAVVAAMAHRRMVHLSLKRWFRQERQIMSPGPMAILHRAGATAASIAASAGCKAGR